MKKKPFIRPEVLQMVDVRLEDDFLQGPSAMGAVQTLGAEKQTYTSTDSWYD